MFLLFKSNIFTDILRLCDINAFGEEKRLNTRDSEGDPHTEFALYSKKRMGNTMTCKSEIKCYCYK